MKSTFELRKFKTSRDPDLVKALKLYSENIDPALRTDTKEIMHWLDKYNKKFEDSFYIVGLYLNDLLIGFSEIAYFLKEKLVIVDYLVIDKAFRKNNTFYQFIVEIEDFIRDENLEFNYIVAEVGCYYEDMQPPESSRLLIRLLKIQHFGVLKCSYYTPRLGLDNHESEMRAILMVYTPVVVKQIKKETFLQIVNAIYFKYFLRWYDEFLDEDSKIKYSRSLHALAAKIESGLGTKKTIEINGMSHLFSTNNNYKTKLKSHKLIKILTALVLLIFSFIIVGGLYLFIHKKYGVDASTLSSIFYIAFFIVLFALSIIFEGKANLFSRIIEKLVDKI